MKYHGQVMPLLRHAMELLQVWPSRKRMPASRFLVLSLYGGLILVPMLIYLVRFRSNFVEFSQSLCETAATFLMVSKFAAFICNNSKIHETLEDLERIWETARSSKIRDWEETNEQHLRLTQRNTKIVIGCFLGAACKYTVLPLLVFAVKSLTGDAPRTFTLGLRVDLFGLDYQSNRLVYLTVVGPYTLLFLAFSATHACAARFIPSIINYSAYYFKYVGMRLQAWDSDDVEGDGFDELKAIIIEYQEAIRISSDLEECFNLNFLFQYSTNIFFLCFILFGLDLLMHQPALLTNLAFFCLAIQSDLVMCSFYGQQLINESEKVATLLYLTNWLNRSLRVKKTLLLTMQLAQKQRGVTAGKFYFLSFASYRQVLTKAWTYFLFLQKIYH